MQRSIQPYSSLDPRNIINPSLVYQPRVCLVGRTQFFGIPEDAELIRADLTKDQLGQAILDSGQDQGSDLERLIEFAARQCYDSYGRGRSSKAFHRNIKNVKHGSVLEHATWNLWIEGVSRGLTHELVRHRVGVAISQRSTRYAEESESRFVVPPVLVIRPEDTDGVAAIKRLEQEKIIRLHREACAAYDVTRDTAIEIVKADIARTGQKVSETTMVKIGRGAARSLLGNGLETGLTWTVNVRTFANASVQRFNSHAEAEIRQLFEVMWKLIEPDVAEYLDFKTNPDLFGTQNADGIQGI